MSTKALTFDYFRTLVDVDKGGEAGIAEVLKLLSIKTDKSLHELYLAWDIRNVRFYRGAHISASGPLPARR